MINRLALVVAFTVSASFCAAQSLQQYIALRKQHGVKGAVDIKSLNSLLGSKVLEIRGVVKGSFKVGERAALMVDRGDGGTEIIDAAAVPDWLLGNETPARLLVRAFRERELEPMRAVLIGAAPEVDISRIEKEEAKRIAATQAAAIKRNSRPASRGGLSGPIGRGTRGASYTAPRREWILPASEVTPVYAAFIKKQNKRLSNGEALRMAEGIVGFSLHYKVDPRLIIAMVLCESGFDPVAVSRTGAMGLGQLMPGTARWMGVQNPFDSVENIYGAVKLMRTHLNQYNESLPLSLAAYNAGVGAVKRHGGVPPYRETQNYVRKVIAIYYQLAGIES